MTSSTVLSAIALEGAGRRLPGNRFDFGSIKIKDHSLSSAANGFS